MNIKKRILHFRFLEQKGFSVVEIILASALFLIFSGASIIVVLQGFDADRTATDAIVANEYAIEGIEAVRSIRDQSSGYSNLAAKTGANGVAPVSSVWAFSGGSNQFGPNGMYTRVITISTVNRDGSGNIVSSGGSTDPNTMKVTSTVTWNVSPTRHDSVVQTTYLTNWRGVNAI